MNAIGYIRVSTNEQGEQGVSLDAQRRKVRGYAELYDIHLVDVVEEVESAKTVADRPRLLAVLERLANGEADAIVVPKLDRLTRSVRDLLDLVDRLQDEGWQLLSVEEQLDTRSPNGRLVMGILALISQWERETIGERTRQALAELQEQGVKIGRAPFGWRYAAEPDGSGRRPLVADEVQQITIEYIKTRRAQGHTLRRIADSLNAITMRPANGSRWWPSTVRSILEQKETTDD